MPSWNNFISLSRWHPETTRNLLASRARQGKRCSFPRMRGFHVLFMGADSGGERAAAMYSLIGSARMNGIDPEAYLRHIFTYIADLPIKCIDDLLPWKVAGRLTAST